jgi:hypothetical protein
MNGEEFSVPVFNLDKEISVLQVRFYNDEIVQGRESLN